MSTMWNRDGSAKASAGTAKSGGGAQHHSIFGWADEKAQKATTENRDQSSRTWDTTSSGNAKTAAGMKTKTEEAPKHKVAESKLKDMKGHNIFAHSPPVEVVVKTGSRRVKEMQGNNIFTLSDDGPKKDVSANKHKEMRGHSGIFGDDGAGVRISSPSLKVSQPAGGRSTFTFG